MIRLLAKMLAFLPHYPDCGRDSLGRRRKNKQDCASAPLHKEFD